MFIKNTVILPFKQFFKSFASARFCTEHKVQENHEESNKKSYYMPKREHRAEIYKPANPITFKNGRYLVYLNKQNLLTPFALDLHYTVPLTFLGYLIWTNPFYLTFPAALPLLTMVEALLFLRWLARKSHFKRQIQRIYLLGTGLQIELVYSNKIRRIVKDNAKYSYHFIIDFERKFDKQQEEGIVEPTRGMKFPSNPFIKRQQVMDPFPTQYGWTLRDIQFQSYILPAKFQYADWEILTKIMNGVNIDITGCIEDGAFLRDEAPPIQQQIKNLKNRFKEQKQEK